MAYHKIMRVSRHRGNHGWVGQIRTGDRPIWFHAVRRLALRLGLTCVSFLWAVHWLSGDQTTTPNIILIMADDLGYGDLGCYGQSRFRTPRLDQMASEGIRFEHFYAGSPQGAASRATLMTGRHTGHATIRGEGKQPLDYGDFTLAECLKQASYRTCALGQWGMGQSGSTGLPNLQGFDEWFGFLDLDKAINRYPEFLWRNQEMLRFEANANQGRGLYVSYKFTEAAMNFIQMPREEPFFLYVSYTLPGVKADAPTTKPYSTEAWSPEQQLHAATIYRLDRDVGKILDLLDERGLTSSTLVLFCSDNGPEGDQVDFFQSTGSLRMGGGRLYEGHIRSPLILRWRGHLQEGQVSQQVCAAWDLLPTLGALSGVSVPDGLDGISLVPVMRDGPLIPRQPLYWETHRKGFEQAVRMGHWKGIRPAQDAKIELYNLLQDPGEVDDLASQNPDVVQQMREIMKASRTDTSQWPVSELLN